MTAETAKKAHRRATTMDTRYLFALFISACLVAGCNTMAGAGKDVQRAGAAVESAGDKVNPHETEKVEAVGQLAGVIMGSQMVTAAAKKPGYAVIRVYFATDRNRLASSAATKKFGTARGASENYGTCDVSIPRDHRMGQLESPSILKLEFREDPKKHIVVLQTKVESKGEFFAQLAQRVSKSKRHSSFIFIHGYNVTFEDAARRTAQMAYDLGFDGAPVFYSWPSRGNSGAYFVDAQNIDWAQANIQAFLSDYFARSGSTDIYLIAHSMGNRALTRAVSIIMTEQPNVRLRLKEVILSAPDIDAQVFVRDIAPALAQSGRPVTLYASSKDKALQLSRELNGAPRAGDSGNDLVIAKGIETIDATNVDTSFIGHSYYGESKSVLSDIFGIIRTGANANDRFGLSPQDTPRGRYWIFRP